MDFNVANRIYVLYSSNTWKTRRGREGGLANKARQCISYWYTPRKTVIQLEGSFVYFYSVWYTHHTSEVN